MKYLLQVSTGSFSHTSVEAQTVAEKLERCLDRIAVEKVIFGWSPDRAVNESLVGLLEKRGIDYRMMILPDHPTPIKLKTHVSDPVPYIIYDSTNETDKNANLTYTEENGKKTGIYIEEGYTLMNRFLGK